MAPSVKAAKFVPQPSNMLHWDVQPQSPTRGNQCFFHTLRAVFQAWTHPAMRQALLAWVTATEYSSALLFDEMCCHLLILSLLIPFVVQVSIMTSLERIQLLNFDARELEPDLSDLKNLTVIESPLVSCLEN